MQMMLKALMVTAVFATSAVAQPLAERVPGDAIFYAGWAGAEKLGTGYAQSHLKGVVEASGFGELFAQLGPGLVKRVEALPGGEGMAREVLPGVLNAGEAAWRHATALYVGPLDYSGKQPMPKVAVFCEAGKDAKAISDFVTKVAGQLPPDGPVKVRVQGWPGDLLVVSNFEINANFGETLQQREPFRAAVKQGRPEPAVAVYFDSEKVISLLSLAMMGADERTSAMWRKVLTTTGIAGLKRVYASAGFDGKDWGTQVFVDAPNPRIGLLASALDSKPVGENLLKLAPGSSTWVSATRFDLSLAMRDLRNALAGLNPNASQSFEAAIGQANAALGLDLQKDLLAPLGDQWLAFNSAETGHGVLGLTLVNPLRDAGKTERALATLEVRANAEMAKEAQREGPILAIKTGKVGDLTIHSLAIPFVMPCWAIKGDTLYVALYPQVLVEAAGHDAAGGATVVTNEGFAAARKRLGVTDKATSLSYMDLPKLAPRGYPMVLMIERTVLGFGEVLGVPMPTTALPPLSKVMPHLSASAGATWVDEAGWHYRGVTPFPGADLLGGEQAALGLIAPVMAAGGVGLATERRAPAAAEQPQFPPPAPKR